jgi:transcription elongation factor S-II
MTSIVEREIIEFRNALDKLADTDEGEKVVDIVAALKKQSMSIELLSSTGIGATLQTLKKTYVNSVAGLQVKALISQWRKDCDSTKKPTVSSDDAQKKTPKVLEKVVEEIDEEEEDESHYDQLEPTRRKMMDLFVEHFKSNTQLSIAKFLAFNVESSINKLHNIHGDGKAYLQKAKSIAYNLKKNESLRLDLINGSLQADYVAYLSANELATDDIKGTRVETAKNAELARRGDLYEITRSEILSSNGIDPEAQGDFICRKCKGSKCTHYSMQTRSSDEPMTVFVCCLTCGKRWRE